jgi:hypothetical protein
MVLYTLLCNQAQGMLTLTSFEVFLEGKENNQYLTDNFFSVKMLTLTITLQNMKTHSYFTR